jgi:SNF2 family DNA or RNA helicase
VRTFGTLRRSDDGKAWNIEAQPYAMIRLKRIFERARKNHGVVEIKDTEETCRELLWFMGRFPLEATPADHAYLEHRAELFNRHAEEYENILGGKIAPRRFDLALPLRDYQAIAAELALRSKGLLIADDLGLGKTATAIATLCDPATRPALVVTLSHLPRQWQAELKKFAPALRIHIAKKGTPYPIVTRPRRGQLALVEPEFPDVLIMNYHKLAGWADALAGVVKTVIFDEGQELRRKGSDKADAALQIARGANMRIATSATPIYNYGGEFWNVFDVLNPGAMATREEFLREWCKGYGASYSDDKASIRDPKAFGAYLREQGLMIRRTQAEVGRELPEVVIVPHYVECDATALDGCKDTATALAKIVLSQQAKFIERGQAAREFDMQMRQATGIGKAPYVAEFVKMLVESGEKVVLYGWHRAVYQIWLERLKHLSSVMFTGSESPSAKEASRRAFMEDDGCRVLIMSLRAGQGLDGLQGVAHVTVFGELDWSYGVMLQCIGRLHRDGQPNRVVVYYLLAEDGSDPVVADVLGLKRAQLQGVIDPDAALVQNLELDPDHIKKLARAHLERHGVPVEAYARLGEAQGT